MSVSYYTKLFYGFELTDDMMPEKGETETVCPKCGQDFAGPPPDMDPWQFCPVCGTELEERELEESFLSNFLEELEEHEDIGLTRGYDGNPTFLFVKIPKEVCDAVGRLSDYHYGYIELDPNQCQWVDVSKITARMRKDADRAMKWFCEANEIRYEEPHWFMLAHCS